MTDSISSLFDTIKNNNFDDIEKLLKNIDINHTENGVTPLWVAITGSEGVKNQPHNQGSYEMVEYLINHGANPNKACITVPPVYISIIENDLDILSLLLNRGASPNGFKVDGVIEINKEPKECACRCKLALINAIDNHDYGAVEALLSFKAVYNKETIKRANSLIDIAKKKNRENIHNNNIKYINWIEATKIHKILKDNYNESINDAMVSAFLENNKKSYNNLNTFFIGLQIDPRKN